MIIVLTIINITLVLALDSTSPSWQNQGQNSTHVAQGQAILLYSQGFDNETGLRYAWLETNETGIWQNKSIFYLNTFNDSKSIKNITFTEFSNKTVWIRLPKNSNVLSATVKMRGYPYPNTTLNTTDETSDWYSYYFTGGSVYVINPLYGNDSNYSSAAECAYASYPQPVGYCHFIENYTTPSYAKGANIFVKAGCPKNCMIEDWYVQCWNWTSNNSWIRVGQSKTPHWSTNYVIGNVSANITPESFPDCWGPQIITKTVTYDNIANYSGLYEPNNGTYYEEKVYWLNESYPSNPYLSVGEDTQVDNVTDDTQDAFGYYTTGGNVYVINEGYYHDQNWNSSAECAYASYPQPVGYCHFMENYTAPSIAKGANIFVKAGCPKNCMIEDWYAECWDWSTNSWKRIGQSKTPHWSTNYVIGNVSANITPGSDFWGCWGGGYFNNTTFTPMIRTKVVTYDNIANYSGLYEPNNGTYWEGKITWFNRLNLDGDLEWQYSGVYSATQTSADFSKEINDYLLYCFSDASGYCNVSLMLHSDNAGRIELSDLNVTYLSGNYVVILNNTKGKWLWTNFTWKNDSVPAGTTVGWRIHYQDGDYNKNSTDFKSFKVKIPTNCSLTGLTNHIYGITDTPLCTCNGDGVTHLYRNNTLHDNWNNVTTVFEVGTFNWTCNMTEGNTYAYSWTRNVQTISKLAPSILLTNNTSWTVEYPTATNIGGTNCPSQLGCALYRNSSAINSYYVKNNASQSVWNETFGDLLNRTLWINLLKNDTVRSIKMSLTGFYMPANTTLSKYATGEKSMWMEYDGTYLWISGTYNGRTYKHKPGEAPSTYYNFTGPIVFDGTYLWTQNWNGGNITKRNYSNPNIILGQFTPPDNCYGNISRGMTWGITWMGPQGSPSTNVGNHLIYYCDVNNTTAEPIYWLNETKGLEQGYCNSTNGCILKTCGPGYNIINDLTFDKATNRLYGVFDSNPGGVGIFKIVVDNTQGYCPGGPGYSSIYPANISTNSGLALKRTDLVWYGTGNLIDTDSEFEKYYLINFYDTYPSNLYLDAANNGDIQWTYTGGLSTKVITSESKGDVAYYLSTCTPKGDGTCDVPFVLHSDSQGIVQVSEILVINDSAADPNLFNVGTYVYKYNTTGNDNYTSASTTNTLTVVNCISNSSCDDSNECTDNICINPGTVNSYCSYTNLSQGTQCGLARDCPSDMCNGFKGEFYPDDGHDTCDGNGNCQQYSCTLQNSYCTDNDPFDGFNSLECGAECDQTSDCAEKCSNKKWYSSYSCNLGSCGCDLSNLICSVGHCGASCDGAEDCGNKCIGEVRYYSGSCLDSCDCSWTTENCDSKDGCYPYDSGCEDRNHYCTPGNCDYTYSGRNTDYNDSFVIYCSADTIRKHRMQHDFFCDSNCIDHTSWVDDQLVENCNLQDGWYNTTNTQWIELDQCNEKEQIQQEYHDYTCSDAACNYAVTDNRWIDTGQTRNKQNGISCEDEMFCTVNDVCSDGVCGGTSRNCSDSYSCTDDSCNETNDICLNTQNDNNCVSPEVCRPSLFPPPTGCGIITSCTNKTNGTPCDDGLYCNGADECQNNNCVNIGPPIDCSVNNLQGIATCDWNPDNYHPTWDFRNEFISICNENQDACTYGDTTITHACNQPTCGASCDESIDCSEKCNDKKWYSTYSCNAQCNCDLSNSICSLGHCGAECVLDSDCPTGKICTASCICSDITQPVITILSPLNATYYSNSTPLTFTVDKPTTWVKYSLDNQPNTTITGNIILTTLANGPHNIIVYANDTSGKIGSSNRIYFTNNASVYLPWETSYISTETYPVVDIEEYNSKLYFAANNKLYVFDGSSWNIIQAPTNALTLQNYTNKLYVAGSGGKIYSYDGTWNETYNTNSNYAKMLGVYNSKLYAATYLAKPAKLFYSSNGINWYEDLNFSSILDCSGPFCSIDSMGVYNGKMYIGSGGKTYRYDGTWSILKTYDDVYSFQDMKVFNGKLYLATRDQSTRCPLYAGGSGFCGRVIEYNETSWNTSFDSIGSNGYWIYSLEVYHNKLYAGTANKIYKWDGNWQVNFNSLEGAQYAIAMKTWNDKIYVGFGNGVMFKDDLLELKPDLIIEDILTSGSTINYRIKNKGSGSSGSSYSKLWIDDSYKSQDSVSSLATGSSSNEYFTYTWTCSGTSDTIKVCADANSNIAESDENNNCITKIFVCPTTCTCTPWVLDDTGCCKIRTCTPKGCALEKSCNKYCVL